MALHARVRAAVPRVRSAFAERFGVDPRALVAMRVALGALLFADLLLRARSAAFFYTDAGALPRTALSTRYPLVSNLSVHALFGGLWWTALLFVLAAVAALALLTGYRTRTAALCSWLLLVSLHARNPLVLNAGDSLLRRTLLWSLFLPLGTGLTMNVRDGTAGENDDDRQPDGSTAEGVDTAADGDSGSGTSVDRYLHPAATALLVQPVVLYGVNAIIKLRGGPWTDGSAVRMVFSIDSLTVAFGHELARHPELLEPLATAWVVLLCCSPLLLLATGRARVLLVAAFGAAHLGMALTLGIGLFPLICVAALLPFLPTGVWDAVERQWTPTAARLRGDRVMASVDWVQTAATRVEQTSAGAVTRVAGDDITRRFRETAVVSSRVSRTTAATLLVGILLWNAAALGYVGVPEAEGEVVGVTPEETRWDMFAPSPPSTDVWYVAPGSLRSNETVEAIRGGAVRWTRADGPGTSYPSARWRKYWEEVRWSDDDRLRRHLVSGLCHRWNAGHDGDERLDSLRVYAVRQPTRLDGPEPSSRARVGTQECTPA